MQVPAGHLITHLVDHPTPFLRDSCQLPLLLMKGRHQLGILPLHLWLARGQRSTAAQVYK
jgi:hypothetical protein